MGWSGVPCEIVEQVCSTFGGGERQRVAVRVPRQSGAGESLREPTHPLAWGCAGAVVLSQTHLLARGAAQNIRWTRGNVGLTVATDFGDLVERGPLGLRAPDAHGAGERPGRHGGGRRATVTRV